VTAKTNHFSLYALFPVNGAPPAAAYRPLEKVVTPNGDGKNDTANFSGLTGSYEIKIFDTTGRLVRGIRSPDLPQWDGMNDNGEKVENGAYIYQYRDESSSSWVSGMLGVAK
jgi:gliding motility-associated-like protein